ncbi:hypothetical protein F2Q68_00045062 [Brassica cretica]|uniref:Uncharacterized protein n=2 Tax=Brassica cretica TaxID=69181 RepID=A0A8S9LP59_BRACR|nr:hypothetical protein F2Q68_00045062 [Brassica cretica]KAF3515835.1 hypothetical protein DY000_02061712 [Brassica cretica]
MKAESNALSLFVFVATNNPSEGVGEMKMRLNSTRRVSKEMILITAPIFTTCSHLLLRHSDHSSSPPPLRHSSEQSFSFPKRLRGGLFGSVAPMRLG